MDKETGRVTVIPSREDSYERLLEAEKQFAEDAVDVEDTAIRAVLLEKLNQASLRGRYRGEILDTLPDMLVTDRF